MENMLKKTRDILILLLVLMNTIVHGTKLSVPFNAKNVSIQSITYNGNGCPTGSVGISLSK